jgi:hypothetical protein
MKTRIIILFVVVALIVVGSEALAQFSSSQPWHFVKPGTTSGGHYRLSAQVLHASGVASGGGYQLTSLSIPSGTGTPCCCNYLPCVLMNH